MSTPLMALATACVPVGVRADIVALDHVARGARAGDIDAHARIAGDDVASAHRRPAHVFEVAPPLICTPSWPLARAFGAGLVGADIVALDHVGLGARAGDQDAVAGIAGDDVEGTAVVPPSVLRLAPPIKSTPSWPLARALGPVTSVPI